MRDKSIIEAESLIAGREYISAIEILEPLVRQDRNPEEHSLLCKAYLDYIMWKFNSCAEDVEYLRDVVNGIYSTEYEESIWERLKLSEEEGASMFERALQYFEELKGGTMEAENDTEIITLIYERIQYIVHELGPKHYDIGSGKRMKKLDDDAKKFFQGESKQEFSNG